MVTMFLFVYFLLDGVILSPVFRMFEIDFEDRAGPVPLLQCV